MNAYIVTKKIKGLETSRVYVADSIKTIVTQMPNIISVKMLQENAQILDKQKD